MKTETIICDRCKRDSSTVHPFDDGKGYVYGNFSLSMYPKSLDLCPECFAAFIAWVDLGDNYENQS